LTRHQGVPHSIPRSAGNLDGQPHGIGNGLDQVNGKSGHLAAFIGEGIGRKIPFAADAEFRPAHGRRSGGVHRACDARHDNDQEGNEHRDYMGRLEIH
jgi:hypothetical protein